MMLRDLRVSALLLLAATAVACAEEPTEFTGSSTASVGPAGPGATSGKGSGGGNGDGGSSAAGDGGSSSSNPDTSSGDGGDSTAADVGSGGAPPQTVGFDLELDDTAPDVDLRSTVELTITITENDYAGDVLLHVDELPDDVTPILEQESITLDASGTTTVGLTLETFSDTVSGEIDFTVTGTTEDGTSSTIGVLVVHPTLTIMIPQNLASFDGQDNAFGLFPTMISQPPGGISGDNPVTIHFFNGDDIEHEIHAQNPDQGFPHSDGPIGAGEMDGTVREVNQTGQYDFYPHDLNNPNIPGRIVIQ